MSVSVCIMYVYCKSMYYMCIYIYIYTYANRVIILYEYHRIYIYIHMYVCAYIMHMLILWQSQWHKPPLQFRNLIHPWQISCTLLPRQSEHIGWTSLWIIFINHKPEKFRITPTTIIYSDVAVRSQTQFIQMFNNLLDSLKLRKGM